MIAIQPFVSSLVGALVLVLLVGVMRKTGLLKDEHSGFFAKLTMNVSLPAALFLVNAAKEVRWDLLASALCLSCAEIGAALVAGVVGRQVFKLQGPRLGAFVLASTFGSVIWAGTSLVPAYTGVEYGTLLEFIVLGPQAVTLMTVMLGIPAVVYAMAAEGGKGAELQAVRALVLSPAFFGLLAGTCWSIVGLPSGGMVVGGLFQILHVLASALPVLLLAVLFLEFGFAHDCRERLAVLGATALKLALVPLLAFACIKLVKLETMYDRLTLLLSAMPTSALAVVIARHYGADAKLAAKVTVLTLLVSAFTLRLFAVL